MPKLYHLDGKPYHNTIEYSWVGIPNKTGHDEYMVNPEVANYIEQLEERIDLNGSELESIFIDTEHILSSVTLSENDKETRSSIIEKILIKRLK